MTRTGTRTRVLPSLLLIFFATIAIASGQEIDDNLNNVTDINTNTNTNITDDSSSSTSSTVIVPVEEKFDDCDVTTYYANMPTDVSTWDRDLIHSLIMETHRNEVNFTNRIDPGIEDVWGALIDVDAGDEPNTVRLIYSDDVKPSLPFGERSWVREFLFPISRGPGFFGPDATDIHNIRPATPLSTIVVADKYYGVCEVLTQPESCVAPAEGAGDDTCSCNRIFEPPASKKGDIARALMYMDVRYDGSEPLTLNLRLTDCPFLPERDMAYLSQMLTWHIEDPPDEVEIARNNKVCANWQGNRNPFVDYPDLANIIFPAPLPLPAVGERLIYEKCEALPTQAPTFQANECDLLSEGDVVIWLLNTDTPSSMGFYSFAPLEEGFELYITDRSWDGNKFLIQDDLPDGTLKFTVPAGFEDGGKLFGFGLDGTTRSFEEQFETVEGTMTPSQDGEPIFIYCISASGAERPLTIFNNGGILAEPYLTNYTENESALPENFPEEGIINLDHFDNLLYRGPGYEEVNEDDLKIAIRNPANWEGSDDTRYGLSSPSSSSKLTGTGIVSVIIQTCLAWVIYVGIMMINS